MTLKFFFFLILSSVSILAQSQVEMDDTVCVNKPTIIGTSVDARSYYWNFCSGNLQHEPKGKTINIDLNKGKPAFIDFAFTNEGIYAVVSNHETATISLLYFGDKITNTPKHIDLGNFNNTIPDHTQGIQIVEHSGKWYCFVTGGQKENSKLVRLDFGNSLTNTPSVEEVSFPDLLDYPVDLKIIEENGNWYGYTVNYNTSTLVQYSFGTSPQNTPTATIIADEVNLTNPCGITEYEENGNKYLLISNYSSHTISKASFGTSYGQTPTITTYESSHVLQFPFDLTIIPDCEKLYGFVLNRFGEIVRMQFDDINTEPTFELIGEADYLFNPQGISDVYRMGDSLFVYVANIDNSTIAQVMFPECNSAEPAWSSKQNNDAVTYSETGNINVRLEINTGTENEEYFCKNIEVVPTPEIDMEDEVLLVPEETAELDAGPGYTTYEWSTGETSQTIETSVYGMYYVTVSNEFSCTETDSIEVKFAGIPTLITPNGDGINDTWDIKLIDQFPESEVSIFDRYGNLIRKYDGAKYTWNGTNSNGQDVRADSYWYIIDFGGDHALQKGHITVIRGE